jgi:hypothetical protein
MSLCGSGGKEDVEPSVSLVDDKKIGSGSSSGSSSSSQIPTADSADTPIKSDESRASIPSAAPKDEPLAAADKSNVPLMAPATKRLASDPKWPPSPLGKPQRPSSSSRFVAGINLSDDEPPSPADTLDTVNAAEPPSPIEPPSPGGVESLQDPETLASLPREELRNRIGHELYPLVEKDLVEFGESDVETIRRVTGMLLETDDECQLLQLIANNKRRKSATGEALQIIASRIHKQPLTQARLEPFAPARQKNIIGEHLYPLVEAELTRPRSGSQPELAGRITGMLLHDGMESSELLEMVAQEEAEEEEEQQKEEGTEGSLLHQYISHAIEVLKKEGELEER